MPKIWLPDVNLWLALAFDGHVHHVSAKRWFDGLTAGRCCFCRLTQQGFLRLATNPRFFRSNALTLADVWQTVDTLQADPGSNICMNLKTRSDTGVC